MARTPAPPGFVPMDGAPADYMARQQAARAVLGEAPEAPPAAPPPAPPRREDAEEVRAGELPRSSARRARSRSGAGEYAEEPDVVLATVDEATATSLIIRNLSPSLTQEGFQGWLDEHGYGGAYDFAFLFPSYWHGVLPYAFVNFVTPAHAQRIMRELHMAPSSHAEGPEDADQALSIAYAQRQGFAEYFALFSEFFRAGGGLRGGPFFADAAVARLARDQGARLF